MKEGKIQINDNCLKPVIGPGRFCLIIWAMIAVVLSFGLLVPHSVSAATIWVNTLDDEDNIDGDCSLREAIRSANMDTAVDSCVDGWEGADIIEFDDDLSGQTIGMTLGELQIADDLTINGLGADELTVDGNRNDIFRIDGDENTVMFTDISIENGEDGIGINGNDNTVTVTDSKITHQIFDDGLEINGNGNTVTVANSVLEGNEDNLAVEGSNNTVVLTNSTIKFAREDGVEIDGDYNTVTVENSTLNDNGVVAGDPNDGLDIDGDGNVVELQQITFSSNREDGLDIEGDNNNVTVVNCTFKGNGITGILIDNPTSTVSVKNSIIAYYIGADVGGDFISHGYNLIGDGTGSTGFNGPGDQVGDADDPIDPGLGDFLDLGTPDSAHFPLLKGSPAIDAGKNDEDRDFDRDQVGHYRFQDGNKDGNEDGNPEVLDPTIDIGAIEFSVTADLALYYFGTWYFYSIEFDETWTEQFGWDATVPVHADYDGDGKTDLAVYHPATGTWYIMRSTKGFWTKPWHRFIATPVPGDYDGDGADDIALYNQHNGKWYVYSVKLNKPVVRVKGMEVRGYQMGWRHTDPVPADYDGDGITDLAAFHPPTAKWYIRPSTGDDASARIVRKFGLPGIKPVPADYDNGYPPSQ